MYSESVYKEHPRDQHNVVFIYTQVVFICRFNNMENIPPGTCKNVVFISRWSLYTDGLWTRFDCMCI